MFFVADSNFLIQLIRRDIEIPENAVLSTVVIGEVLSMALRRRWGSKTVELIETAIEKNPVMEVSVDIARLYGEIESYAQGRNPNHPLPLGVSSRNMGKNDLWVAATALYFNLPLVSGDLAFRHLVPLGLMLREE
jgi:tRNA(fMet)-specific endonuclease VapC